MSKLTPEPELTFSKRMTWFVMLWLLGFAGTMLLAMPFHFLVRAAMAH
ncbi:hypothetical protein [Paraburkholderia acidisoli]|uniref:DUF2474 domain-containing protein n=1 Tax=Paraburkholderia acidisoli TaxID=2571748 RepID=A0A7Z2GJP6_9BURK|nr:hypothetical protein [Paraburkholderia acidisoli]QGZ63072.1 hypothetical protein FAZ98_14700 [Paraburkholderia acidisoli]